MMTTTSHVCHAENCAVEVPEVLDKEGLCLNHYLDVAFRKLGAATERFHLGEEVDCVTMEWLLAQVDFTVERLGQEDMNWDPDQRSRLLELLLGVANLNEYMRHSIVLVPPSR
jgi:hypothetical protein